MLKLLNKKGFTILALGGIVASCGRKTPSSAPVENGDFAVTIKSATDTRFKDSTKDRTYDLADGTTLCAVPKGTIVQVKKNFQVESGRLVKVELVNSLSNCQMKSGYIYAPHFDDASQQSLLGTVVTKYSSESTQTVIQTTQRLSSVVSSFLSGFRSEFQNTIYKLGSRGPSYYDCSTSIAYMFVKLGLLKDSSGTVLSVSDYRNSGSYDPAYMDQDSTNFRVLQKNENLHVGDLVLMGGNCAKPSHWAVISGIDSSHAGEKQSNWRINRIMEVKGGTKNFDEGWNQRKYIDNDLCAAVRYKGF